MARGLGLDISDNSIEVLELTRSFFQPVQLAKYSRREIPEGLVEDGLIKQAGRLAQEIKELFAQSLPQPITENEVVVSVPEAKTFIHIFKLPINLAGPQINEALQYQLPEVTPYELKDIYYAWQSLGQTATEQEVLAVAVPREIINAYLELFHQAALKPLAITLESVSTARAILPPRSENNAICLLDLGARTSLISIFDSRGLRYSYNHPQGGQQITENLSRQLGISYVEAENFKIRNGLDPQIRSGEVAEIVEQVLKGIIQEVKKSIIFYENNYHRDIDRLVLVGGTANLPKLPEYLTGILVLPVSF